MSLSWNSAHTINSIMQTQGADSRFLSTVDPLANLVLLRCMIRFHNRFLFGARGTRGHMARWYTQSCVRRPDA